MYLIVTRTFPPEIGGMQNLMWGLTTELSKHYMIKVFADYQDDHKEFDDQVSFSIENTRISIENTKISIEKTKISIENKRI